MPADAELSRHDPDAGLGQPVAGRPPAGCPDDGGVRLVPVHTDHHIGRLLDFLKETGQFDNTLIMLVSDNGASPEGGVTGTTNEGCSSSTTRPSRWRTASTRSRSLAETDHLQPLPVGVDLAGNTPFRRWKRGPTGAALCDPFLVHWPAGINAHGEVRNQYALHHRPGPDRAGRPGDRAAVHDQGRDPGADPWGQLRPSFNDQAAPTRHTTQYFEMFGHRSIDHDG